MKDTSQLHIKLPGDLHSKVKREASKMNFTVQEFAEKALHVASEIGLEELYAYLRSQSEQSGKFRFIDLFAGIGGIRMAFEAQGGQCVFSSEWDKFAQKTYFENFKEVPKGDITKIEPASIPDHDVLMGGFPCQPFSLSGISKKNSLGRAHGFLDKTQGTLFFNIVKILEAKRPKMFLLENVKHLKNHDKGNTFKIISGALEELGYAIFPEVIDARNYVPQHRERIYIVGYDKKVFGDDIAFEFPKSPKKNPKLKSILEKQVDDKYILTDHLWEYLQNYAEKHRAAGHGFGFGLVNGESVTRTLSARYHKDGSEILIERKGGNPRRLTPRECARLMGYPASFRIPVSDTQAYRQFGNSVVVPVVTAIAKKMVETYSEHITTASK